MPPSKVFAFLLLLAIAVGSASSSRPFDYAQKAAQSNDTDGELWALLVAGSAGWGNYRHQADVAHAYQVLRRGGLREDRIVVMAANDIAHNPQNPHPGKLFNQPGGPNVYEGLRLDYTGPEVNAANFLAVLRGKEAPVGVGRHSSGRVIASGPNDRVFVYYSDHGAPGVVGMPSGPFLYADQLHDTLGNKSAAGGFKEMVIYLEACESGSMFDGLLEPGLGVFATTAANGRESSWGTYCPGMEAPPPPEFNTCLGDLYSVAWLEDSDHSDLTGESLKKQYQRVRARTSSNFTYRQGSHVMRWGALDHDEEPVAQYLGELNTGDGSMSAAASDEAAAADVRTQGAVPQRDADLLHLFAKYSQAEGRAKAAALRALNAEVSRRSAVDAALTAAVAGLLRHGPLAAALAAAHGEWVATAAAAHSLDRPAANHNGGAPAATATLAAALVAEALPRAEGTALVSDWGCLRGMVGAWEASCGRLDQYGMQHTRAFSNLCNSGLQPGALAAAAQEACSEHPALRGPNMQVSAAA